MPKSHAGNRREPAQPLLQGINLARFLCDSCPFHRMKSRFADFTETAAPGGVVRSAPPAVPPASNTGVHHESQNRGAASSESLD